MKKIKYVNSKKPSQEGRELEDLKGNDDLCGAVLDTLSEDYLAYISHLVKNSKTPIKKKIEASKQYHSSDTQSPAEDIANLALEQDNKRYNYKPQQFKSERHHSESGSKSLPLKNVKFPTTKEPIKSHNGLQSLQKTQQNRKEVSANKQRNKMLTSNNQRRTHSQSEATRQAHIQNNQKTLAFTQNRHYPFAPVQIAIENNIFGRSNRVNFTQDRNAMKRVNTQQVHGDQLFQKQVSLQMEQMKEESDYQLKTESDQGKFITNIDEYLFNLQYSDNLKHPTYKNLEGKKNGRNSFETKNKQERYGDCARQSIFPQQEYSRSQIDEILKQNIKLKKKVKGYQQKIDELQDQVSSHFIQCRKREKQNKKKFSDLIQALTIASEKINSQKDQISSMKGLLHTFGRKVKQMESRDYQSESIDEEINESIAKMMKPARAISNLKIKKKLNLQSTMPKHYQEKGGQYW